MLSSPPRSFASATSVCGSRGTRSSRGSARARRARRSSTSRRSTAGSSRRPTPARDFRSASVSRSKPIDFVITWRNLLAFASSSVIEPALELLGDPRVIVAELPELAVAEHVAARVTGVDEVRLAAVDQDRGQRRAHAAELGLGPRRLEDRAARAPDDAAHHLERRARTRIGAPPGASAPSSCDRDRRREVAGRLLDRGHLLGGGGRRLRAAASSAASKSPRASASSFASSSTAIRLAVAPPWWPPMPSATASTPVSGSTR